MYTGLKTCRKKTFDFINDLGSFTEPCILIPGSVFKGVQRSRLYFLLVSEQLVLDITSADTMPGYCSDHSLVCVAFKTDIVKRNRPFWKFNNSLLRDPIFVNLVKQVIHDVKKCVLSVNKRKYSSD